MEDSWDDAGTVLSLEACAKNALCDFAGDVIQYRIDSVDNNLDGRDLVTQN